MSADWVTYVDSSAIVKLVVAEPESSALRKFLKQREPLVSSALARVEVMRALLPAGNAVTRRGHEVLRRIDLIRINDRVLDTASAIRAVRAANTRRDPPRHGRSVRRHSRADRHLRPADGRGGAALGL